MKGGLFGKPADDKKSNEVNPGLGFLATKPSTSNLFGGASKSAEKLKETSPEKTVESKSEEDSKPSNPMLKKSAIINNPFISGGNSGTNSKNKLSFASR